MDDAFTALRSEVEFALARLAPELREAWSVDVERRFRGWRTMPEYAVHQGVRKLVAEFYVRALNPPAMQHGFYDARNVVLDYLEVRWRGVDAIRSLPDDEWPNLAKILPALFDAVEQ